MSGRYTIESLHPLTRRAVNTCDNCRTNPNPSLIYLCDYHEGFDAGVEKALEVPS